MAAALEEHGSLEVLNQNEAIEALKKENDNLEAKKAKLALEVRGLTTARAKAENLRKETKNLLKEEAGGGGQECAGYCH